MSSSGVGSVAADHMASLSAGIHLIKLDDIQGIQARNAASIAEVRERKLVESERGLARFRNQDCDDVTMEQARAAEERGHWPICFEPPQSGDSIVKFGM